MDEILKEILKNKYNDEKWAINKYPDFHHFILNKYSHLNIKWKEMIYLYSHNLEEIPKCICGIDLKYEHGEYRKYCSIKCMSNDPDIINKKKKTCLIKYGEESPTQNEEIKSKVKKTVFDKYNVSNVSKLDDIKCKVRKSNNEKYGVDYISQLDDVKLILRQNMIKNLDKLINGKKAFIINNIIDKIKNLNIELLDITSSVYKMRCEKMHIFNIHKNMLNDRINNKNVICTICNPIDSFSDSEKQLFNFIRDNYDGEMFSNVRNIIGQEIDIYIPDLKLGFEFNGLYWHSDNYKSDDYHYNKTQKCVDNGIRLIHVWEDDWLYKSEIIKSMILNLIGKSKKIYARSCEIKEVNKSECRDFLNNNHIQGYVASRVSIGLYYKSELVSLMTFGKLRKCLGQNSINNHYELLRFCNKKYTSVIGGASKLFKYFLRTEDNVLQVISYADRSWSNGALYKRLGFDFEYITKPNYYYVIDGVRKNRFNYRKDKILYLSNDKTKTEREIMRDLGYYRIYNSGNFKFKYENLKN